MKYTNICHAGGNVGDFFCSAVLDERQKEIDGVCNADYIDTERV